MRKVVVIVMLAGLVSLVGCATYNARGIVANPDNFSLVDKNRMSTKNGDGIVATAILLTKDEVKKYFDEDLLGEGIVPVFIDLQCDDPIVFTAVTLSVDGAKTMAIPMTSEDLYAVIKRDWFLRATGWFFTTYMVGGPVSALDTYFTNRRIRTDLDSGKILSFGSIKKGATFGFLCFRATKENVSKQNEGQNHVLLKLVFQKNEKLLDLNLEFKSLIE